LALQKGLGEKTNKDNQYISARNRKKNKGKEGVLEAKIITSPNSHIYVSF